MLNKTEYNELRKFLIVAPFDSEDKVAEKLFIDGLIAGYEYHEVTDLNAELCVVLFPKTAIITEDGRDALEEFEKWSQNMSEQQAEKKADRKFQLFNTLLGAVLGIIGTLLVQWILG